MELPQLKIKIIEFIESHKFEKGAELYGKIISHVREHGTNTKPRGLHGDRGSGGPANPQV